MQEMGRASFAKWRCDWEEDKPLPVSRINLIVCSSSSTSGIPRLNTSSGIEGGLISVIVKMALWFTAAA
jgi:hypothetical protein